VTREDAEKILRDIETKAEREFLPIVGAEKGKILQQLIRKHKPKRILEIGTLVGYSAILMGKELESDATIMTIEIHAHEAKIAERNITRSTIKPTVRILVGDALDLLPSVEGPFDLVFIDADKEEYLDYLRLVETKTREGTIVVADNAGIFADQMKNYLEYVRKSGKFESRFFPVEDDGLEVSTRL
jgi:predicted O-methyltransferase YrrM